MTEKKSKYSYRSVNLLDDENDRLIKKIENEKSQVICHICVIYLVLLNDIFISFFKNFKTKIFCSKPLRNQA